MFDLQLSAIEQLRVKSPDKFVYEQPVTPQNLINDVMSHIRVDSSASILVLFTVEWALYLRKIGFVDVTVAADNDPIIANACLVFGLKYQDISNVEKNNMKFDVVVGNPPYNSSSGGPHGTAGNNILYRQFTDLALKLSKKFCGLVVLKGIIGFFQKKNIHPEIINLMTENYWEYDTCYFVINKTTQIALTDFQASDAIVRKMFSTNKLFNFSLVDGSTTPVTSKTNSQVYGIIGHKSAKHDSVYGYIDSKKADQGWKFLSNLYGGKSSWTVTDDPSFVPGFTFFMNDKAQADKFVLFLENNKALKYFRKKMKQSNKNSLRAFKYIKRFELSQIVTGFEYPAEWNLTQDEIELIEATVK